MLRAGHVKNSVGKFYILGEYYRASQNRIATKSAKNLGQMKRVRLLWAHQRIAMLRLAKRRTVDIDKEPIAVQENHKDTTLRSPWEYR